MASLKIQVLGRGLIPRGYGLAPHIDPFSADKMLISTILATPGLKVNYINPNTMKPEPLTSKNLRTVWEKFSNVRVDLKAESAPVEPTTHPVTPDPKQIPVVDPTPVTPPKAETPAAVVAPPAPEMKKGEEKPVQKPVEKKEEKKDEKKDDRLPNIPPVSKPDNSEKK